MNDSQNKNPSAELFAIREAIIKSGGDPAKQLAGFLLSEDPIYLPETDGARATARTLNRDEVLEYLINEYFG
jgi:uncharacterized protein (UPF0297 family)